MKKSVLILLFFITLVANAQGNLQFNRVLTLTAGSNYTVPSGKVLKIESISTSGSTICIPRTSEVTMPCLTQSGYINSNYGIYDAITYLSIGNIYYKTGSFNGQNSSCSLNFNSSCANVTVNVTQIQLPLWLEAGKNIQIYANTNTFQILISAIEFNITP
jgi:hypothetical protein